MRQSKTVLIFIFVFLCNCSFAQNGYLWGDGGKGYALISSLSSDNNGNCMAFGLFHNDTVEIGSYFFQDSTSNLGFFVMKIDPYGNILWAKQAMNKDANGYGQDDNNGMAIDIAGNTYCTGAFSDSIVFGSTTLVNNLNVNYNETSFLAKYDPNGNIKWAKQFQLKSDTSDITSNSVSTDSKGNCYVVGIYFDTVSIGGNTLVPTYNLDGGGGDFLVKYDSNGIFKWVKQSSGEADYWSMTNDRFGNSIITGDFFDTVTFGSDTVRAQNYFGGWAFTVKYDSSGNVLWARQATSISHFISSNAAGSVGWKLVTDLSGNIYVLGVYGDTVVFAPDTLINRSAQGLFLVKYDPNGNVIWAKQPEILDNNEWNPDGLAIDKYNDIYFSGDGGGSGSGSFKIQFGDTILSTTSSDFSSNALFVFKIDSNANVLCGSILPGGGDDDWNGLASDSSGKHVYISGPTIVPLIFGQDTITPPATAYGISSFVARWEACDVNLITINQNIKTTEQVILYPNPNNGKFNIQFSVVSVQLSVVDVYNMLGEKVFTEILRSAQGDNRINLSNLPSGLYLYRVIDGNGGLIGSGKFVMEK
ncbi:MAG TPA: T9SS type A sorting domain-containing protein [Bacteroidia bacterium]|jgi:hypothetical protein|nr:T9SS type A sorting domain-containing protein [Bacteroidia bacterium]